MASQSVAANSRLEQMQSRFQQEREQRRLEMFGNNSATSTANSLNTTLGNGRVRQMFDDRRRGVGIDRSSPLKPITSSNRLVSQSTTNLGSITKSNGLLGAKVLPTKTNSMKSNVNLRRPMNNVDNANLHRPMRKSYHEQQTDRAYGDSISLVKGLTSLSLSDNRVKETVKYSPPTPQRVNSSNNSRLNSVLTKKSSVTKPAINSKKSTITPSNKHSIRQNVPEKSSVKANTSFANGRMPISRASTYKVAPKMNTRKTSGPPPAGMLACRFCGRHFNEERFAKHEDICQKVLNSKKYVYDAAKHRLHNTETETFLRKHTSKSTAVSQKKSTSTVSGLKNNNWRRKHEEFIAAIRAAKQVQAHLAKGGKLSDLPPPPPSENPDYIQCPHCLRRFNEAAASRHIPKCANMLHNKPKPGTNNKKR